jgi:hypothetical protein
MEERLMNENIPDKKAYQNNRRYMAWGALSCMIVSTLAVCYDPSRFDSAEAIMMMMYGSLSALVASYFGFSSKR